MNAGREMDAKVAMKVMEWELINDDFDYLLMKSNDGTLYTWFDSSYPSFRPSTDIAAAMPVAEKMIADGWGFSLIYYHSMGCWQAEFFTNVRMRNADANTPAEAICEAALKAVEDD